MSVLGFLMVLMLHFTAKRGSYVILTSLTH